MSVVTKDPDRLMERSDTLDVVYGLDPFFYRFENDTLSLFFAHSIDYTVKEKFETIVLTSTVVTADELYAIQVRSEVNDGYHSVPKAKKELPR